MPGPAASEKRWTRWALTVVLGLALALGAAVPALAAPAWQAPVDLSAPGKHAYEPVVAMDQAGDAVAVWEREGATPFKSTVQASTRAVSQPFSSPIDLAVPAQDPVVAMTPGGEAVTAWWHFKSPDYVLQVSRRPPGGSFSPPVDVTEFVPSGSPPQIHLALNQSGAAALAWIQRPTTEKSVAMVSTLPAAGPPAAPVAVSDEEHPASEPSVAIDASGTAMVVWNGYSSAEERENVIEASTGSGSAFSAPVDVSTADAAFEPRLALDPFGEATVAWLGLEEKPEEEWKEPGKPEFLPPVIEETEQTGGVFSPPQELSTAEAEKPQVAIGSDGTAVIAWVRVLPLEDVVEAVLRPPGGELSPPDVVSPEGGNARGPAVAVSGNGAAVIAWQAGGTSVVDASVRPPGASFGVARELSDPAHDALFPQVAMDQAGDAVVVWRRSNGTNEIIQAAGYDAGPPELRNVSIPSSAVVGDPVQFSATSFDVWPIGPPAFDFGDGVSASGASVSHVYSAPGTYRVTASVADSVGTSAATAGSLVIVASNRFTLGKLKLNRRRGTATLTVNVPGPGSLALGGAGVKRSARRAAKAGDVGLTIRAAGKAAKRLRKRGKAMLKLKVDYAPDGGPSASQRRSVVLKRARAHPHGARRRTRR